MVSSIHSELIHELPGRVRLAVKRLKGRADVSRFLESQLKQRQEIREVKADWRTGRMLILFDLAASSQESRLREIQHEIASSLKTFVDAEKRRATAPRPPKRQQDTSPQVNSNSFVKASRILPSEPVLTRGLGVNEVEARLRAYGPNVLPRPTSPPWWKMVLVQMKDAMTITLWGVAGLSILMGRRVDALCIAAVIGINAAVGILQERRTNREASALAGLGSETATVIRLGVRQVIPAAELVPGDIVCLEAGDRVPADGALLQAVRFVVDESALTGESVSVVKTACKEDDLATAIASHHAVYLGTGVTKGQAKMVVLATGGNTTMGLLAQSMSVQDLSVTPLQQRVRAFGRRLVAWVAVAVLLTVVVGIVRGIPPGTMVLTGMTLAASAIPEGLPVLITIAMAAGVRRMSGKRALVRKLSALETMGRATVICSDKTGTLTKNEMTVRVATNGRSVWRFEGEGYDALGRVTSVCGPTDRNTLKTLARCCVLCNDAAFNEEGHLHGDPTEGALLVMAQKAGIDPGKWRKKVRRMMVAPFESERRRMSVVCTARHRSYAIVKGAVEVVLPRCKTCIGQLEKSNSSPEWHRDILSHAEKMAQSALRVVCIAYKLLPVEVLDRESLSDDAWWESVESDLIFVGLVGMVDPPRQEVRESVQFCRNAGIKVVMITGDHPATAMAIAHEIGLTESENNSQRVLTGADLDGMGEQELCRLVDEVDVFARVTPHHKLSIIRALKKRGHVVAMTGDGVNDAPAIRQADIGIAMGRKGTDLAREASAMTITDDNFVTIVAALQEGRGVFANIRRALGYLLSGNLGEVLFVAAAVMLGLPLPLLPVQILLINLFTDAAPTLALLTQARKQFEEQNPMGEDHDLMNKTYLRQLFARGSAIGLSALASLASGLSMYQNISAAQTMAMVTLVSAQTFQIESWYRDGDMASGVIPKDRVLRATFWGTLALLLCSVYIPPFRSLSQAAALSIPALLGALAMGLLSRYAPAWLMGMRKRIHNQSLAGMLDTGAPSFA